MTLRLLLLLVCSGVLAAPASADGLGVVFVSGTEAVEGILDARCVETSGCRVSLTDGLDRVLAVGSSDRRRIRIRFSTQGRRVLRGHPEGVRVRVVVEDRRRRSTRTVRVSGD